MSVTYTQIFEGAVVENEVHLTLVELCHTVDTEHSCVVEWVSEGILNPTGTCPEDWLFSSATLSRAKQALILSKDLEINTPGIAVVLDLLDEISHLRKQLKQV